MKKEEIYVVIDDEQKKLRALNILNDAGENIDYSNFELSEILRFDSVDKDWFLTEMYFKESLQEITLDQLEELLKPKEIKLDALKLIAESYGFELVEKKREIKVGNFGKFWDVEETNYFMGFLKDLRIESQYPYREYRIGTFRNFRHLTEQEKAQITENW